MKVTDTIRELIKLDLQKGKSIRNIAKTYDVKKDVIREIQDLIDCETRVRQSVSVIENEPSATNADNVSLVQTMTAGSLLVTDQNKFDTLLGEYDILISMIEEYKQTKGQTQKQTNKLVVELPVENDTKFRITQRVNDVIYNEFREFADNNRQFTIKELLSQALKEFTEKYK